MRVNRRKFFQSAIAFVAALLTPKPKATAAPIDARGWPEPLASPYVYFEDGHKFYFWPEAPAPRTIFFDCKGDLWEFGPNQTKVFGSPLRLDFHRNAFTLESPRLTPEEVDGAFDEVNRMIDRWSRESLFPAIRIQDFVP